MTKVVVSVAVGELASPRFEFRRVHFDGRATTSTSEVVVVGINHATSIEALTAIGHDDVDFVRPREGLELGVNGRERDAATVARDECVEFLGANEALDATEHAHNFTALGRISRRGHDFSVPGFDLYSGMILISLLGMILEKAPTPR